MLALLLLAPPAGALVVLGDDPAAVERSPSPSERSGWDYVAKLGPTSAVYLGDGWVITANHVRGDDILLGERTHRRLLGSRLRLGDPEGDDPPDLALFQVKPPPDLAPLPIAGAPPAVGEEVVLIGCGKGRGERLRWKGVLGYQWLPHNVKRWGTGRVHSVGDSLRQGESLTHAFQIQFGRDVTDFEAQGALGDSGGAVFVRSDGRWTLAGLIISVSRFPKQPENTAIYGNLTQIADLSRYREQIRRLVSAPGPRP